MIELIKNFISDRIIYKILGFVFALGVIPILIFLYGLDDEPKWISQNKHHLQNSYALTIEAPLELFNIAKSKDSLKQNANIKFINEFYNRAFKQIKISYDWDNLDSNTKKLITINLNILIKKIDINLIKEQSTYEDKLNFTIYGLYSIKKSDIDILLQEIYSKINEKVLEVLYK